jgi:hypothetical protein
MLGGMNSRLPSARFTRPALLALSAALTGSLVLAGCGGSSTKGSADDPASQATSAGTKLAAVEPLTGLPAKGNLPKHPVVFVKIDNSIASNPQVGVSKADMVFEELVEGGITRLAVAYYSQLPKRVGPVRSARATDIGIVLPTKGALLASGAAPSTKKRLENTGVNFHSYDGGTPGVTRDTSDRSHDYLHSVFADLPVFAKSLGAAQPPAPYLPWGTEKDFVGTQPAKNVTIQYLSDSISHFAWNGSKYIYTNSYMPKNDQFKPDSILVIRVKAGSAGYLDPAGSFVPESYFYGHGQAVLFHAGQAVRATWKKPFRQSPLQLSTLAGGLKVPAGHVWIAILPVNQGQPKLTFR